MTAPTAEHDKVFSRWLAWLEEALSQVTVMKHHEQLWRTMVEVLQRRAGEASGSFKVHYTRLYVDAQVMGIRRIADRHAKSMSLRRMLEDIVKQPQVLTRSRYVASAVNSEAWVAQDRDRRFNDLQLPGTDHIDPAIAQRDLQSLIESTERVCDYVDRQVAHVDPRSKAPIQPLNPLTFGKLHDALGTVGAIVQHWENILRDAHTMLKPIIQDDWKGPFRQPLFAPPEHWRDPAWDDSEFDYTVMPED